MDLASILASLSPDEAAGPMPAPIALPSPAAVPSGPARPAPLPMPIGDVGPQLPDGITRHDGGGIADQLQQMLPMLISGLMAGSALKGSGPYGRSEDIGGLAQGLLHGYHTAKQGQLASRQQGVVERRVELEEERQRQDALDKRTDRGIRVDEQTQKHKELASTFVMNAVKGAEPFKDDPVAWASYTKMMAKLGQDVFGIDEATLNDNLRFPDVALGKKLQKDAAARVADLAKLYGDEKLFAPEVLDATTTFNGKPTKVRDLLALSELAIVKAGDAPATAPTGTVVTPQPKEEPLDRQVLRAYAKKAGKAVADLTPADIKAAREEAGMGPDPEARRLAHELAQQRLNDARAKNAGTIEITEGTPDYRRAEALAFGRLTLAQAKGLYSFKDKEKLRAVLDKAEQINPNFNAALFEQGYKFASNVKTQTAMAAIDSVAPNIDRLIELSDKWDRTKYPSINAFLKAAKFQWGNQTVSDFGQLQTIVGDELGTALGSGSASDLKVKLGLEMSGGTKGPEAFRSSMLEVKHALHNRKAGLLGQMGPYGQSKADETPTDASPAATTKKNPFRK